MLADSVRKQSQAADDDKENYSVNIQGDIASQQRPPVEKQNSKLAKNAPNFEEFRMIPAIIKPKVITNSKKKSIEEVL